VYICRSHHPAIASHVAPRFRGRRDECAADYRVIGDETHARPSLMGALMFTPRTGSDSMNVLSFSAAETLSFTLAARATGSTSAQGFTAMAFLLLNPAFQLTRL